MTASDSSHEKSLFQLLDSISNYRKEATVFIWDLGLTNMARRRLERNPNLRVLTYEFAGLPAWMQMNNLSGAYAWKPICIDLVIKRLEREGNVPDTLIWLDAGCVLTSKIPVIEALALKHGIFANQAKGTLEEWTSRKVLETFEEVEKISVAPGLLEMNQISAALIAFHVRTVWVLESLERWSRLASVQDAIAPHGADKSNHRFDQSILSLILRTMEMPECKLPSWPQSLLGFKIHQDID